MRRETVVEELGRLYDLTRRLRRECPWDRRQTQSDIVAYTLEETYELVDTVRHRATRGDAAVCGELGDLLFALATYGRKQGLDPEAALRASLNRFSSRFRHCELAAQAEGKGLRDYGEAELDEMWERAKAAERDAP